MPPKKNNKTAHVLNLLTTNEDSQQGVAVDSASSAKPETARERPTPSVIDIQDAEKDPVSDILRNELEKTFASEKETATVGDELLPHRTDADERESRDIMSDELLQNPTPVDESFDYVTVNVVEDIIRSRTKDFMAKMGACTCDHCVNDVIALTLNDLPPKYTVTHKGMLFTKIASYENQYSADISKALTKACMLVMESPRH